MSCGGAPNDVWVTLGDAVNKSCALLRSKLSMSLKRMTSCFGRNSVCRARGQKYHAHQEPWVGLQPASQATLESFVEDLRSTARDLGATNRLQNHPAADHDPAVLSQSFRKRHGAISAARSKQAG